MRNFLQTHREAVFGFLLRRCADPDLAADLTQETFVRYLERYADQQNPAILFTIARNLFYDGARRAIREKRVSSDHAPLAGPHDTERRCQLKEEARQVLDALSRLPEADRELLALVAGAGLGYKEIGKLLGLSPNTVKVRVHRARVRLRALLTNEEGSNHA